MASRDVPTTPGSVTDAYEKTVSTPVVGGSGSSSKKGCSSKVIGNVCIGVGALVAVAAVVVSTAVPAVVNSKVKDGVVTCNAEDYKKESYLDPYGNCEDCTPYYYKLHMFNATNAQAHLENGEKLKLKEVGPYTYRRWDKALDVSFDGEWVKYKKYSYYTYESEMSCEGCSESDIVISYDVGYLNVLSAVGGESGFYNTVRDLEEVDDAESASKWMRYFNGLNSMNPLVWNKIDIPEGFAGLPALASFLAAPDFFTYPADEVLAGFEFNGLFAMRPIKMWAQGSPSLIAGLGLSNYHFQYSEKCEKGCTGDDCPDTATCKKATLGKKIVLAQPAICDGVEAYFASVLGAEKAKTVMDLTCRKCGEEVVNPLTLEKRTLPLCFAPLPGTVQSSGIDYSKAPPSAESLGEYIQNSGCKDQTQIGVYKQFDGYTSLPLWAPLDSRRNPTLKEIAEFANYADCTKESDKYTCAPVNGNDATSIEPQGVGMTGFKTEPSTERNNMYLSQGKQNVTLMYTGEEVDVEGIPLQRFMPPNDMLASHPWNKHKGTGYPVDGVQPLAFSVGFLAYLSYPVYLYGDKSLYENIEITMSNGEVAKPETLYNGDKLKDEYKDMYATVVDMEAGLGKTMSVLKRLMASYAVAKLENGKPLSDLVWPDLKPEVIVPAYWGEESSQISDKKADSYKSIAGMVGAMVPILVAGLIIGVGLIGGGFFVRRRATTTVGKSAAGEA